MISKILCLLLLSNIGFAHTSNLKRDISFFSASEQEGRKPGTQGNLATVNYIKTELQKMNLEYLSKSPLQEFTIFTEMKKNGENSFAVADELQNFEPLSYSLSGELKAKELVFAGFGISIPEGDEKLSYDDYKDLDVEGKVVVVFTGDPGIGNSESPFRSPDYVSYSSIHYKLNNAVKHKAAGLILINDPLSLESYPIGDEPVFRSSEGGGSRFSIIAGQSTNRFLNKVLEKRNLDALQLQKKIAKATKPFSFSLNKNVDLKVSLKKLTGRVANVVAFKRGTDEKLSKEVVVIGGHLDHIGYGGSSSMEPGNELKIHHGADDNASGTALVLSLAAKISKLNTKRTYMFVFFNAEEMGLLGSAYFADMWARYKKDYGEMVAMLNFDMVGRYNKAYSVMGTGTSKQWKGILEAVPSYDFKFEFKESAVAASDHASFINKKVPSLFFTSGAHEDYHRSTDTEDKINYPAIFALERFGLDLVAEMDKAKKIEFNPEYSDGDDGGRNRGYGAHLGCVPQFNQSDKIKGVLCMRASKDSPAEKAGIQPGDVLVQIGEVEINNIYDLSFALKYYRAGDKVEIAWKRKKKLIKARIVLKKSKRH